MESLQKKLRFLYFLVPAFLLCLAVGKYFLFPNLAELKLVHQQCRKLHRGVNVPELTERFGTPQHAKEGGDRYLFGSPEYAKLFSGFIVAVVNAKDEVTSLSCGDGEVMW